MNLRFQRQSGGYVMLQFQNPPDPKWNDVPLVDETGERIDRDGYNIFGNYYRSGAEERT